MKDSPPPGGRLAKLPREALIALTLAVAYLAPIAATPERVLLDLAEMGVPGLREDYCGVRLFQDNYCRGNLLRCGAWARHWGVPYLSSESEYPQVATYVLGLPHRLGLRLAGKRLVLSAMMLAFLVALVATTQGLLTRLGKPRRWALLLCLPASLYFSAHRHDSMVAVSVAVSLLLLFEQRTRAAAAFLVLAMLTKWYPVLFAPLFVKYVYSQRRRVPWAEVGVGAGVLGLFVLQTLLWSGWDGLLAPYRFQLRVGDNEEAFFGLLRAFGLGAFAWKPAFALLQLSPLVLVFCVAVRTKEELLAGMALAVMAFICFGTRHSPQWLLWLTPLLVLAARSRTDLIVILVYDLLTFVYFPLGYDLYDSTWVFTAILTVHAGLRALILVRLGRRATWICRIRLRRAQV